MFPGIIPPIVGEQLFVFETMPGIVMSIFLYYCLLYVCVKS